MAAAKKTDPLALRDELREQRAQIDARHDDARQAFDMVEAELTEAHRRLAAMRLDEVLGEATVKEVEGAQADIERLEAEVEKARIERRTVAQASKVVAGRIAALHVAEREAFIADAMKYADQAAEALEALREPYERAYAAWGRAQSRWTEFIHDLDDKALEQNEQLGRVPSWPWLSPTAVFEPSAKEYTTGRAVPRIPVPWSLQPTQEPSVPEPGTHHIYTRYDGHTVSAPAGSDTDSILDRDPEFRLTETFVKAD